MARITVLAVIGMLAFVQSADAQLVTVDVKVESVEPESRRITVSYKTQLGEKSATLDVSREPRITINGAEGSLQELKPGHAAKVEYQKDLAIITKIVAKGSPFTDWPCWRGPHANGVADGRNLPSRWSQTINVHWSVKLPGWGTSSPVVYGNRVYITSEVQERGKKSLLTLCFDRETGKELWRHDFGFGVDQKTHEKSNLAVNTPAVTDDAVYVAFGNADIARYSHDGRLIWVNRYIASFGDPKMAWGYGLSPVVLDDAGKEWWGSFPWSISTPGNDRIVVIVGSNY